MELKEAEPLAGYTTLHIGGVADFFVAARSLLELREALSFAHAQNLPVHILGGGSNVLIPEGRIPGLTIRIALETFELVTEGDYVMVRAGAGMNFDALIARTVQDGLWGLENLSAIPGTVGATPVQNVGAYGVEVSALIVSVEALDMRTGNMRIFTNEECQFGYRHSIFKEDEGRNFVITAVVFRLSPVPRRQLSYRDLALYFSGHDEESITLEKIREAVVSIRSKKFPDWRVVGTAGSFFKNPLISKALFDSLEATYPGLPGFPQGGELVKVSLGWIMDNVCDMRGLREGNVGTYEAQALVVVNYGGATARELDVFANRIAQEVEKKTNIKIEREVTKFI